MAGEHPRRTAPRGPVHRPRPGRRPTGGGRRPHPVDVGHVRAHPLPGDRARRGHAVRRPDAHRRGPPAGRTLPGPAGDRRGPRVPAAPGEDGRRDHRRVRAARDHRRRAVHPDVRRSVPRARPAARRVPGPRAAARGAHRVRRTVPQHLLAARPAGPHRRRVRPPHLQAHPPPRVDPRPAPRDHRRAALRRRPPADPGRALRRLPALAAGTDRPDARPQRRHGRRRDRLLRHGPQLRRHAADQHRPRRGRRLRPLPDAAVRTHHGGRAGPAPGGDLRRARLGRSAGTGTLRTRPAGARVRRAHRARRADAPAPGEPAAPGLAAGRAPRTDGGHRPRRAGRRPGAPRHADRTGRRHGRAGRRGRPRRPGAARCPAQRASGTSRQNLDVAGRHRTRRNGRRPRRGRGRRVDGLRGGERTAAHPGARGAVRAPAAAGVRGDRRARPDRDGRTARAGRPHRRGGRRGPSRRARRAAVRRGRRSVRGERGPARGRGALGPALPGGGRRHAEWGSGAARTRRLPDHRRGRRPRSDAGRTPRPHPPRPHPVVRPLRAQRGAAGAHARVAALRRGRAVPDRRCHRCRPGPRTRRHRTGVVRGDRRGRALRGGGPGRNLPDEAARADPRGAGSEDVGHPPPRRGHPRRPPGLPGRLLLTVRRHRQSRPERLRLRQRLRRPLPGRPAGPERVRRLAAVGRGRHAGRRRGHRAGRPRPRRQPAADRHRHRAVRAGTGNRRQPAGRHPRRPHPARRPPAARRRRPRRTA
ncbi:hypothetical protein RKD48_001524 [Streptomyces ambofaciens]